MGNVESDFKGQSVAGWKEDKESKESKRRKELHYVLRVQEKRMTGCLEKRIIIV